MEKEAVIAFLIGCIRKYLVEHPRLAFKPLFFAYGEFCRRPHCLYMALSGIYISLALAIELGANGVLFMAFKIGKKK